MASDPERQIEVDGRRIAVSVRSATSGVMRPGVAWFGGFMSDMTSTKAVALDRWAKTQGRAMLRFDYSGHGISGGRFEEGTIGRWAEDALGALRQATSGPQILVGSSMGAWIALLTARTLARDDNAGRLAGMVLIAPAVDFTESLMWARLSPEIRRAIMEEGVWHRPSVYGSAYPITRALIEDGRRHLLLGSMVRSYCPVHILQGMRDEDVPWQHAMTLVEHIAQDPVSITLVKDGDHRLSREEDVIRLIAAVEAIA